MPAVTPMFTDFLNGEISGNWEGRVRDPRYYSSCRKLENFIVTIQGNAERAPGSYYVESTKNDEKARLIPYWTADEIYVLEFGDSYIRYYKGSTHEQIESAGSPYETSSPYSADDLWQLDFKQANDGTMYLTHPDYQVRKLTTTGDTSWTLSTVTFTGTSFSTTNNFPRCIGFFEKRMLLGDTNNDPLGMWGSKVDSYEDFTINTGDADAYKYILSSGKRKGNIFWMLARDEVLFGSNFAEGRMTGDGAPITPSNVRAAWQTRQGSKNIKADFIGNSIVFAQKGGKVIREIEYLDASKSYLTNDLTVMANHILGDDGVVEIDVQTHPHNILWCIKDDGELAALTYEKGNGVMAWHRHITEGEYESLAVIDGASEDEIWVIVKRTIDGLTRRYIEYFKPRDFGNNIEDQFFVHSGIILDNGAAKDIISITQTDPANVNCMAHGFSENDIVYITGIVGMTELNDKYYMVKNVQTNSFWIYQPDGSDAIDATGLTGYQSGGNVQKVSNTMSGLDHLESETVDVLLDGAAIEQKVVSSGQISLGEYGNKIIAGLPYISQLKTVRVEAGSALGAAHGKEQIISEIAMRFFKTAACKVGRDPEHLEEINFREPHDLVNAPPPLSTCDRRHTFQGDFRMGADLLCYVDKPQACTICAVTPYMETYD